MDSLLFLLNILVLLASIYQAVLTRSALHLTRESVREGNTLRQLANLDHVNAILELRLHLVSWLEQLKLTLEELENAIRDNNEAALKHVSQYSPPKETIDGQLRKAEPQWIGTLALTGAKWFLYAVVPLRDVWSELHGASSFACAESTSRLKEAVNHLEDMLGALDLALHYRASSWNLPTVETIGL